MSRVFDALRKSEALAGNRVGGSAGSIFGAPANSDLLSRVTIEKVELPAESHIVVYTDPHSPGGERFRQLKSYLKDLQAADNLKTVLITSPSPHDGKSTVATNLATALSEKGKYKILLLEADLRCPSLGAVLNLKASPGLTECLEDHIDPMSLIRGIDPLHVYVLSAGGQPANPLELLQSDRYAQLVASLSIIFDWIIVDAPPVVPIADTQPLKKSADCTVLVVRAGTTTQEAVEEAIRQIAGHPLLGIVLNCAEKLEALYAKYYGHTA